MGYQEEGYSGSRCVASPNITNQNSVPGPPSYKRGWKIQASCVSQSKRTGHCRPSWKFMPKRCCPFLMFKVSLFKIYYARPEAGKLQLRAQIWPITIPSLPPPPHPDQESLHGNRNQFFEHHIGPGSMRGSLYAPDQHQGRCHYAHSRAEKTEDQTCSGTCPQS